MTGELGATLREFHEAFHVEPNVYFDEYDIDPDLIRRQHMLQEEVNELLLAILEGDRVAAADALGDVIYIAAGTADLAGIPIDEVLHAIHAANMRKLGPDGKPVPHATVPGKIGKPEGWVGPEAEIRKILVRS